MLREFERTKLWRSDHLLVLFLRLDSAILFGIYFDSEVQRRAVEWTEKCVYVLVFVCVV